MTVKSESGTCQQVCEQLARLTLTLTLAVAVALTLILTQQVREQLARRVLRLATPESSPTLGTKVNTCQINVESPSSHRQVNVKSFGHTKADYM